MTPIATKYFMAPENDHPNRTIVFNNTVFSGSQILLPNISFSSSNTTNATLINEYAEPRTQIQWAFLISGVLSSTACAGYIASYISGRKLKQEEGAVETHAEHRKTPSKPVFIFVMVILTLLLLLITGWIDTFAGFLTTFCIRELGWSKDSGVLATTVFWIAFCVANFLTIFLLRCFSTEVLLFAYLALSLVSFIGLLLSSYYKCVPLVWTCIALTGTSMSIMWPAIFAWTEETVTEVSRKVSSLFLIAGGVGLMVNPLILGYLMDHVAPLWYVYFLMAEGVIIFISFTVIAIIYKRLDFPTVPEPKRRSVAVNSSRSSSSAVALQETDEDIDAEGINSCN